MITVCLRRLRLPSKQQNCQQTKDSLCFIIIKQVIMKTGARVNKSMISSSTMDHKGISASFSLKKVKQVQKKLKKKSRIDNSKPKQRQNTEKISQEFKKIMEKHLDQKRVAFLKRNFSEYYGKNFASEYRKQYCFSQEWQQHLKMSEKSSLQDINNLSKLQIVAIIILISVYILALWYSNINHFFSNDSISQTYLTVYMIAIFAFLADAVFKATHEEKEKERSFCFFRFLKANFRELCSIGYLILKVTNVMSMNYNWWILELIFSYFIFIRVSKLYEMIRFLKLRLYHTYQSKIIDLILTLLVILHIVAIILFSASKTDYQKTWVSEIKEDIHPLNEFTLYLYAFYFGTTTILTVGYGDIAAKNPVEVGVVIMVEVIGILMFSYLINEIGYSISTLRKGRQIIENDLSVLQKMRKHYNMKDDITNQARNFLINHKPDSTLLEPTTQNNVLLKFNQPLRNDIVTSNNLGIVKSSLFFLTKWTNTFQRSIASKLIHRLFPPNDLIYQPIGNQRIYIFKTGRVNVYARHNHQKKNCQTTLKVIDCKIKNQVADNCYGYTAVISKRSSRLYAFSKDFTSSYFVDKETFMNVVNEREQDFQLYHQILAKMDLQKFSEAYQVPLLQSSRHHYFPTIINIIKKQKIYTQSLLNCRNSIYERSVCRHKRTNDFLQDDENFQKIIRHRFGSKQPQKIQLQDQSLSSNEEQLANFIQQENDKEDIKKDFQKRKQFSNYYKNHNLEAVLKKIELRSTSLDRRTPCLKAKESQEYQNCGMFPHKRVTLERDRGLYALHTEHTFKY